MSIKYQKFRHCKVKSNVLSVQRKTMGASIVITDQSAPIVVNHPKIANISIPRCTQIFLCSEWFTCTKIISWNSMFTWIEDMKKQTSPTVQPKDKIIPPSYKTYNSSSQTATTSISSTCSTNTKMSINLQKVYFL